MGKFFAIIFFIFYYTLFPYYIKNQNLKNINKWQIAIILLTSDYYSKITISNYTNIKT